ncbi:MAG: glycosyltransferase family 1 protein, partial [Candidatus Saccharibacteria bacterium]|nr:glycosyltransferase family 1 protein [Candidatus Saccharibacteria bacterium]
MIVLLVHQSAEMYGSDKVLFFLADGLQKRKKFTPVVVLPEGGPLFNALADAGVEVHIGPVAKISRAVMTPMGLLKLAGQTLAAVRGLDRVVGGRKVAVVHSNTLAVLSGAIWALVRR